MVLQYDSPRDCELTAFEGLLHATSGVPQGEEVLQVAWGSDPGAVQQQRLISLELQATLGHCEGLALVALDGVGYGI